MADPSAPPPLVKPVLQPSIPAALSWKVVSDSQLGGKSNGAVEFSAPPSGAGASHLRFSGNISLELGGRLSSSGFCGFVILFTFIVLQQCPGPFVESAQVHQPSSSIRAQPRGLRRCACGGRRAAAAALNTMFAGVEMLVKCDGRAYTFNVKTDSVIPDDMYERCALTHPKFVTFQQVQAPHTASCFSARSLPVLSIYRYQHPFRLPAGSWHTLRLSWPGFVRTRRGKELASQHQLDPCNIIRSLPPPAACCEVTVSSATASVSSIARKGLSKCSCNGCRATGSVGACTRAPTASRLRHLSQMIPITP